MKIWWVVVNMKVNGTNYCFHDGYEGETKLDGVARCWKEVVSKWQDPYRIVDCYEVSAR